MATVPRIDNETWDTKYIYNLPFFERSKLCKILNQNDKWEELAGIWMKYDTLTIQNLRKEKNPTEELLTMWSHYNHTILELFVLLSKMEHYQSMMVLKPFVEERFHALIDNGEGNLQRVLGRGIRIDEDSQDFKIGAQNFNRSTPQPSAVLKVILAANTSDESQKSDKPTRPVPESATPPSDSNNLLVASLVQGSRRSSSFVLCDVASSSKNLNATAAPLINAESTLPQITYEELALATDRWNKRNVLGKGGFGVVYKGIWKNTDVAIKRIERRDPESNCNYVVQLQQSLREIKILNSRPHENILALYAYSFGGEVPCLVYQFMQNGSLEDRLLMRRKTPSLGWIKRHEIAKGTARGLQYLHTIGDKPLIHGDIKSANILLDKNFEPKIGDFGLAREGSEKESMKVSKVHGTRPYLPEEFLCGKSLSTKIDTYSYGIVLFELATGLTAYDYSRTKYRFLKDLVDNCCDRDLPRLMDEKAGQESKEVYPNLIVLGKWCSNRLAKDRPEMELVFRKLKDLG